MAEAILQNDLSEGAKITVDHKKGEDGLAFKARKARKKKAAPGASGDENPEEEATEEQE